MPEQSVLQIIQNFKINHYKFEFGTSSLFSHKTNFSPCRDSNPGLFQWTEYQADALAIEVTWPDYIFILIPKIGLQNWKKRKMDDISDETNIRVQRLQDTKLFFQISCSLQTNFLFEFISCFSSNFTYFTPNIGKAG